MLDSPFIGSKFSIEPTALLPAAIDPNPTSVAIGRFSVFNVAPTGLVTISYPWVSGPSAETQANVAKKHTKTNFIL